MQDSLRAYCLAFSIISCNENDLSLVNVFAFLMIERESGKLVDVVQSGYCNLNNHKWIIIMFIV